MRVIEHSKRILIAPEGPPVRRTAEIKPIQILHTLTGETVYDMGQNMVGWVRLRVQGKAGTTVTLKHAEVSWTKSAIFIQIIFERLNKLSDTRSRAVAQKSMSRISLSRASAMSPLKAFRESQLWMH